MNAEEFERACRADHPNHKPTPQDKGGEMHTPTPWKVSNSCEDFGTGEDEGLIVATVPGDPIHDIEEMDIAIATIHCRDYDWQMSDHSPSRERAAANAKFIVEAVNSHSTLTEETARLKERVRVLEERLEPFARMASDIHEAAPDSALCVVATLNGGIMSNKNFCTVGDLRRARSALHTTPEVGE